MNITLSLKKKVIALFITIVTILSFVSISSVYSAYDFQKDSGIKTIQTQAGYGEDKPIEVYIGNILKIVFSFVGLVFFILTIYAGIQWMTAQGNSSQVDKAKDTLIKAIVGLVIIMAAYGITYFVVNTFQSTETPNSPPPTEEPNTEAPGVFDESEFTD